MENLVTAAPRSTLCVGGDGPQRDPDFGLVVQKYAPLVRRLAYQLMARLPASVHIDDVIQNGMVGLIDSLGRFEEGMGAQFETYATQRIRGAMIDGLRENDWMPRALRRDMRRIESMVRALEQQHGRPPAETEVARALDMSLPDYQRTLRDSRASQMVHFEDFTEEGEADFFEKHLGDPNSDPLAQLIDRQGRRALVDALSALPEREGLMMRLYYEEDLNLREIGDMLGVSESRVCQLHKQAVGRLRGMLVADAVAGPSRRKAAVAKPEPLAPIASAVAQAQAPMLGVSATPVTKVPAVSAPVPRELVQERVRGVQKVGPKTGSPVGLPLGSNSGLNPGLNPALARFQARASNQPVFHAVIG